jgi:hypothetical protein
MGVEKTIEIAAGERQTRLASGPVLVLSLLKKNIDSTQKKKRKKKEKVILRHFSPRSMESLGDYELTSMDYPSWLVLGCSHARVPEPCAGHLDIDGSPHEWIDLVEAVGYFNTWVFAYNTSLHISLFF